jgi:hypothetical protein
MTGSFVIATETAALAEMASIKKNRCCPLIVIGKLANSRSLVKAPLFSKEGLGEI